MLDLIPFLITPSAPITTGMVIVFSFHFHSKLLIHEVPAANKSNTTKNVLLIKIINEKKNYEG